MTLRRMPAGVRGSRLSRWARLVRAQPRWCEGTTLAVAGGLLYWLALPSVGAWPLAFVCWVPMLGAIRGASVREALVFGWIQGLVVTALGFGFLYDVIASFVRAPAIVHVLVFAGFCAWHALRFALVAVAAAMARRVGAPLSLGLAAAVAGSELFFPVLFPWYAAVQLSPVPLFLQAADVGGPTLVGASVATSSVTAFELLRAWREKTRLARWDVALGLLLQLVLLAYGLARSAAIGREMRNADALRVGVVQGDEAHGKERPNATLERYRTITRELVAQYKPELVVWPETAIGSVTEEADLGRMLEERATIDPGGKAVTILSGVIVRRTEGKITNSAVLFDGQGTVRGVYDKMVPLLFGERLPFGDRLAWLDRLLPNAGHVSRGERATVLRMGQHRITPLICYEDMLPGFVLEAASAERPHLLVNLTNDAWFGLTSEPRLHLALASLRAIEHRRFLVRATNRGVSAVVDPLGAVDATGYPGEQGGQVRTVRWLHGTTLYQLWGDRPAEALVGLGVASWVAAVLRRRRIRRCMFDERELAPEGVR